MCRNVLRNFGEILQIYAIFTKNSVLCQLVTGCFSISRENYVKMNYTVWKFENFSPTIFLQKFRQSNFFTKEELYCKLISRKNF